MKILKYILFIVIALIAIFFLLGVITPSINYENTITVDKPAKEAWAAMMDESKLDKWLPGYQRSELVSGEENAVGAVSNIYFVEENGTEMAIQETITKIVPDKSVAMDFTMDFMDMDYEMSMAETGGKTTITTKSGVSGNGWFARSMVAMMKGTMSSQEDSNLSNLKSVIEGDL